MHYNSVLYSAQYEHYHHPRSLSLLWFILNMGQEETKGCSGVSIDFSDPVKDFVLLVLQTYHKGLYQCLLSLSLITVVHFQGGEPEEKTKGR